MGIRSTALLFGQHSRSILSALSATSIALIGTAGYMADTLLAGVVGVPFYAGLGVGAVQLARVLRQTDFDDRVSCWKGFVGCGWSGFWIWMGAVGNYFYLMS
jgi:4-hydroxybenzoate polyprenyltransferase